jgi:hypothetical protein
VPIGPGGLVQTEVVQQWPAVQRYDSYEHASTGDAAAGGATLTVNGVQITSGEVNALADLYATLEDLQKADPTELQACVDLVRKQVRDPKSVTEADWDKATNGRYSRLNLANSAHFGPSKKAPLGGTTGADNRSTWELYFRQALGIARQVAGPLTSPTLDDAMLPNSFGEHFLMDAFSAGHLFNKDDMMATMTEKLTALKAAELDGLLSAVAAGTWAAHAAEIGKYQGSKYWIWFDMNSADRWKAVLASVYDDPDGKEALEGAVVKSAHDKLSADGVKVKNGFAEWTLSGDRTLATSLDTQAQITLALEDGRQRLKLVSEAPGVAAPDDDQVAEMRKHFPEPVEEAQKTIDALLAKVSDPKGGMADAIVGVVNKEITATLEGIATAKPDKFRPKPS